MPDPSRRVDDPHSTPSEPARKAAKAPPPKLAIRLEEAAEVLSVSTRTVRRLVDLEELQAVRFGRSVRVTTASITAFFERGGSAR